MTAFAETVRQAAPRRVRSREAGVTGAEAIAILRMSRACQAKPDERSRIPEKPAGVRAKQWVPLLAAFSGARVGELTRLRKEDFRQEGGRRVMRITPEAGTVEGRRHGDMLIHPRVIAEGLPAFIDAQPAAPPFHDVIDPARLRLAGPGAWGNGCAPRVWCLPVCSLIMRGNRASRPSVATSGLTRMYPMPEEPATFQALWTSIIPARSQTGSLI